MTDTHLRASDIITALSLALDVQKQGNLHHGWRVGLIAYAMSSDMPAADRAEIFYAGLLHDVGNVGANQHMMSYSQLVNQQLAEKSIKSHPIHSASIICSIPGLARAEEMVRYHHEWWDGSGYPEGLRQSEIPLGAQFIRVADAADLAGCFRNSDRFEQALRQMHFRTGQEWSSEVWAKFLQTFVSGAVPRSITMDSALPRIISKIQDELAGVPELDKDESLDTLFRVFARVIDARHSMCAGHSERVAHWVRVIGEGMNLPEDDLRLLSWCAFVHDAGKISLPKALFDKFGKLSREEVELVRSHASTSGSIFRTFNNNPVLSKIAEVVCYHHERFDGMGYPHGLVGEDIPLFSRIIAVADSYDAMTSNRSHRQAMMPAVAIQRLLLNAGTQFDPEVVDLAVELYRHNNKLFDVA